VGDAQQWVESRRCPFFEKDFFKKFQKFKSGFRKISKKIEKKFYYTICTFLLILKLFVHGKATIAIGLLLCPKSIKNGQIITDLAKTIHFVKYYFNKLQLNFKK
jgi:hypothetical protein